MLLSPVPDIALSPAALVCAGTIVLPPGALNPPRQQIRRLGQDDRVALAHHLVSLTTADRCTRFGGPSSDEGIWRHCRALDLSDTICFAAEDKDGVIIGAALGFACDARLVEVAVSVASEHRRSGLAADLVARVFAAAAARGATGAVFEFHPRNLAIQGLIRSFGGKISLLAEVCVVPLPPSGGGADEARNRGMRCPAESEAA